MRDPGKMKKMVGRACIVTGAAQGLGLAVANKLVSDGASVLLADVQEGKARALADRLKASGAQVISIGVDVSSAAQVQAMAELARDCFGRIDVLVNAAGGSGHVGVADIESLSEELWDSVIDSNLKGTFLCCRAVVAGMKAQRYGRIVNFSSLVINGVTGPLGTVGARIAYAAAKSGLHGFSNQLSKDLVNYNITVNTVVPGFILTEPGARVRERFEMLSLEQQNAMLQGLPNRTTAQPGDVATTISFLASEEAGQISGQAIAVGGMS
jgi:NAD(P)-dependent dehydrogenase (short-subunit alcohol dehydrogenase family)